MRYTIGPLGRIYDHEPECRLCIHQQRGECHGTLVCGFYVEEVDE
jgi:hypothetical protein